MKHWIFAISALVLSFWLTACNTEQVEVPQSKEAYQVDIQARLDELNEQINELKIEAEQRVGDDLTQEDVDQAIDQLEAKSAVITQELEAFGATSQDAWEDFKPGLEAALDDLEVAFQNALANFDES